jgi:hypothetical protein
MIQLVVLLLSFILSVEVQAATLGWEVQPTSGPLTIERATGQAGPFTTIATVPAGTTHYIVTPGAWGWYRIGSVAGPSNTVQFSLDLYTGGLEDRVTALEAQFAALPAPLAGPAGPMGPQGLQGIQGIQGIQGTSTVLVPPITSNLLTTRQIDSTHVELTCVGTSMKTTGSGLRRVVECLQ